MFPLPLPPTVYWPPWEKTKLKIVAMCTYLPCNTQTEMRMVESCQNALSFHGQRNRWPLPFLLPSLHKALNASPMANLAGEMNFSTAERERERERNEFSPDARSGFNQLAGCSSRIFDLRSIERFPDPEIRNLRCFVRPQSASPALCQPE